MFRKWTGTQQEKTHKKSLDEQTFQSKINMADESIAFELGRCVRDIIVLVEQGTVCQSDLIQFRLDWLYNAVVRYCDHIPSGEAVMRLVQGATELLGESERDGCTFSMNDLLQAEFAVTGQPGRPRFLISKDQLDFFTGLKVFIWRDRIFAGSE